MIRPTSDPRAAAGDLADSERSTARRILWARGLRDLGDGNVAVLLPIYLATLGFGAAEVGLTATLALLGSALMTLAIGLAGARVDSRMLLLFASILMVATGLGFAVATSFAAIAAIALIGTINPSAGSVSIFAPLEQAVLTKVTPAVDRTSAFARYSLVGALAAAAGALFAGAPEILTGAGVPLLAALQIMFLLYAVLGLAAAVSYRGIPARTARGPGGGHAPLGPSRRTVVRLAALFSVDSFAGGFAVQSLLMLWLSV